MRLPKIKPKIQECPYCSARYIDDRSRRSHRGFCSSWCEYEFTMNDRRPIAQCVSCNYKGRTADFVECSGKFWCPPCHPQHAGHAVGISDQEFEEYRQALLSRILEKTE